MSRPQNVVIISDSASADFARTLMGRWQLEHEVPAFTLLNAEFWDHDRVVSGDVAIIAPLPRARMEPVLRSLAAAGTAAVFATNDPGARVWARGTGGGRRTPGTDPRRCRWGIEWVLRTR